MRNKSLFFSDPRFGHRNIIKYRQQFSSNVEHDDFVFHSIMAACSRHDTLYLLGDVCFTQDSLNYLKLLKAYVKTLVLVLGNHDSERQNILRQMIYIADHVHAAYRKKDYLITHIPVHPLELRGKINIHGHTHIAPLSDERYVCVCAEHINYSPIEVW